MITLHETTNPEAPALILPRGYDPQPRRWRAVWQRGWSDFEARDGATADDASDALLTALAAGGDLRDGAVEILDLIELPERDDDLPQRRYYRCALRDGSWAFELMEVA